MAVNFNSSSGLEKPDFALVLGQIERFIGPVFHAILKEEEFFGNWLLIPLYRELYVEFVLHMEQKVFVCGMIESYGIYQ